MLRNPKRNAPRKAKDSTTDTPSTKDHRLTIRLRRKVKKVDDKKEYKEVNSVRKGGKYFCIEFCFFILLLTFFLIEPIGDNDSSISDMLAVITKHEEENRPVNDSLLATHALPHTIRHQFLIDSVTQDFLNALYNVPHEKWKSALQPIPHKLTGREKMAPKLLIDLGGEKIPEKIQIANKALIDWMAVMRKKSKNPPDFPWYQPSTQNQRLRTLLGSTSKSYGWRYEMSDFSFKGGLKGFLDKLYAKRYKEFGKV